MPPATTSSTTPTASADEVLRGLSAHLRTNAQALRSAALEGAVLSSDHLHDLLLRLTWIFGVRISHFRRKRYVSPSHEPNKGMNPQQLPGAHGRQLAPDPHAA